MSASNDSLLTLVAGETPAPDALGIHPDWRLSLWDAWLIEWNRDDFHATVDPRVLRAAERRTNELQRQ